MRSSKFAAKSSARLCIIAALCLAFATTALAGNDKALKAQADALLAKSRGLSNLESPGSPPFVLTATVQYVIGSKLGTGSAEIDWLAPGHYRETLAGPGYSYVDIAKDGKRYLSRTNNQLPLVMYDLIRTLSTAMQVPQMFSSRFKKVSTAESHDNRTLVCPEAKLNDVSLMACLDDTGDLASFTMQHPADRAWLNTSYEFSDFAAFGLRRFPLIMKFVGGDGDQVGVVVRRIVPIENAPSQDFNVPIGSAEEAWCAEPKRSPLSSADRLSLGTPDVIALYAASPGNLTPTTVVLYIEVGAGGRPRSMTLIHSSEPIREDDLEKWIGGMQFPSVRCGDDAIEYQTELMITLPAHIVP